MPATEAELAGGLHPGIASGSIHQDLRNTPIMNDHPTPSAPPANVDADGLPAIPEDAPYVTPELPVGIRVIGILCRLNGIAGLLLIVGQYMVFGAGENGLPRTDSDGLETTPYATTVQIIVSLFLIVAATGLLKRRRWGYYMTLAIPFVFAVDSYARDIYDSVHAGGITGFSELFEHGISLLIASAIIGILYILFLKYMTSEKVRRAFGLPIKQVASAD